MVWLQRIREKLFLKAKNQEQFLRLLQDAQKRALFDESTLAMLEAVLQVSDMQTRDIMIPRAQMVTVDADYTLEQAIPIVIQAGHSRLPVVGDEPNEIIGILIVKDLIATLYKNQKNFKLRDILRPVSFIPESKRLDTLLQEFRVNHQHMAIVVDEYGSTSGLVTIEDVLEQIVGDIEDEHDFDDENFIKKHSETTYIVKAVTPIEEFNTYFNANFDDEEADTIGGILLKTLGHLPKRGENITFEGFRFKVLHADNRRIRLLRVRRNVL
ncbi:MAG TPA: transporter associated domain-containing protein [Gammaproteobacteria bacterium]|nr:transporter associated domain-containing protein [Gammaproteobacteria bacterium]